MLQSIDTSRPPRPAPVDPQGLRFALAWLPPVVVAAVAWQSGWGYWAAWGGLLAFQALLVALECVPGLKQSPGAAPMGGMHRTVLRSHVALQLGLLAVGVMVSVREGGLLAPLVLGLAVGGITGAQGISYAHELGHSRSPRDRLLAWVLMASVNYAHYMVEHYRGHHRHVATSADPATARKGESLWAFMPRTLWGSWRGAWRLEQQRLAQRGGGWARSPLAWAVGLQAVWLAVLWWAWGAPAAVFWLVQSAYAVFLLEAVNYIEHYGLERSSMGSGVEPFAVHHAWNTDRLLTNCLLVNLQRHSDHHLNSAKPFAELQALPGPQLPTGYVGCLLLAVVPPLWRRVMHARWPLNVHLHASPAGVASETARS